VQQFSTFERPLLKVHSAVKEMGTSGSSALPCNRSSDAIASGALKSSPALASRLRDFRFFHVNPLHLDAVGLSRLAEIVGGLHRQPRLCRRPESLF
jgi:hypothetical protein